ncbi:MAG: hypothetical protein DDT29_01897 [Dehalococcoidia bacterium]|nr:hypothetical protein [Bacillota bacterium]
MENKAVYGKGIIKKDDIKMTTHDIAVQKVEPRTPATSEKLTASERFTAKVLQEFGSNVAGTSPVTDYQRALIQGYFIVIDRALKTAEEGRLRKNESNKDRKYDNALPMSWANVNLPELALDVMHYARVGLDMMQDNHLFPIPYKNNKTGKYDMTLMPGYNGIRYIAEKYAVEKPVAVTVELVYTSDIFRAVKKNRENPVESYEFEIVNAFDRGEIVGGFGYLEFADPLKNKLIIMPMKDIEKRKPIYASAEFWGGTVKKWEGGKLVEVESAGWLEEMCLKTIKREVYSAKHIPRDPRKIDDDYHFLRAREARIADIEAQAEIDHNANTIVIDTSEPEEARQVCHVVDEKTGEITEPETFPTGWGTEPSF